MQRRPTHLHPLTREQTWRDFRARKVAPGRPCFSCMAFPETGLMRRDELELVGRNNY